MRPQNGGPDRRPFTVITDTDDLAEYPLPRDFRMPTHYYMAWWHNRWLNSTLHLTGTYEVQGVALALFCIAQNQSPIGTLPEDEMLLARLLRMDLTRWRDLCRMEVSPLHGWYRCRAGSEVRLAHAVVLEVIEEARERREVRELSKEERAQQRRVQRLRQQLVEYGLDDTLAQDVLLREEMNEWLEAHCKGRRGPMWIARALQWAQRTGVIKAAAERSRA
jgi:hypothetical protein